jgi:hypothetical protein
VQQLVVVDGPPRGPSWIPLAHLDDHLDGIVATVAAGPAAGRRDVAGSYLAGWLTHLVAGRALAALRAAGRTWSSSDVAVHPHPGGWFDGLAVPADRAVADGDALVGDLVASLGPAYGALRRRVPFGLAGMWGTLADVFAGDDALVDALGRNVAQLRTRPRLQLVDERVVVVRSTCCLWFKVFDGTPDPDGEGYCTTCPHRSDTSRAAMVRAGSRG